MASSIIDIDNSLWVRPRSRPAIPHDIKFIVTFCINIECCRFRSIAIGIITIKIYRLAIYWTWLITVINMCILTNLLFVIKIFFLSEINYSYSYFVQCVCRSGFVGFLQISIETGGSSSERARTKTIATKILSILSFSRSLILLSSYHILSRRLNTY